MRAVVIGGTGSLGPEVVRQLAPGGTPSAPFTVPPMKRFRAGDVVVWRSVSLDHVIGRAWPMTVVGDADDLIAVYLRPGTVFNIATGMMGGPRDRVVVRYDGRHRDAVWRAVDALILYWPA